MRARALVLAAAISSATALPSVAQQTTSAVLVDPDLTVGAGATITAVVGEVLARAGDAFVPHRLWPERGVARRSTNVAYRLLKLAYVDAPQESLLLVINHELFGHGARLRERFDGPISYAFGIPPPYGGGGGSTSFVFDRPPSLHERLAVHAAGMEASAVAADLLAARAARGRSMTPRDALRYLAFELDTPAYVLGTDDTEEAGHDIADFLHAYNELSAKTREPALRARTLKREALAGLANPMLAYAAWGLGRYVATGATDVRVPMLTIAGVRYLPLVRYRLTPYGREWSLVNELAGRLRPLQVELRFGRAPAETPWAIRIRQQHMATAYGWMVDGALEVWRQPALALRADDEVPDSAEFGAQVRARLEKPLMLVWFSAARASIVVDVGLKSAGFVPGEPLRRGVVARAGVGVPLER